MNEETADDALYDLKTDIAPPLKRSKRIKSKCASTQSKSSGVMYTEKKKTKVPSGLGRKKAGKLSMLMTMPIDVFYEIASNVKPMDLLNLSRSSHSLRNLLMSKKAAYVWRAARENISLPRCPSELSEPQYADLIFGHGCHHCQDTRARKTYFSLCVRLCKKCSESYLTCGYGLIDNYMQASTSKCKVIYQLVPSQDDVHDSTLPHSFRTFFKPTFDTILQKLLTLKDGSSDFENYVEERKKLTAEVADIAAQLEQWKSHEIGRKQQANLTIISARKALIFSRLKELGFEEGDFNTKYDLPEWKWKKLIEQPNELTDRVWANIKPQLEITLRLRKERTEEILRERRRRLMREEIQRVFDDLKLKSFAKDDLEARLFRVQDLFATPLVKAMIEDDNSEHPMKPDRKLQIEDALFELAKAHARTVERDCYTRLAAVHRELDSAVDISDDLIDPFNPAVDPKLLRSATAFFTGLPDHWEPQSYAGVLQYRLTLPPSRLSAAYDYLPGMCTSLAWKDQNIVASKEAVDIAVKLLQHLGFSKWTSMTHLMSKGRAFLCNRCKGSSVVTLNWIDLVQHFAVEDSYYKDENFKKSHKLKAGAKKAVKAISPSFVDKEPENTADSTLHFGGVLKDIDLPREYTTNSHKPWDCYLSDEYGEFSDDDSYDGDEYPFYFDDEFDDYYYGNYNSSDDDDECVIS